MELLLRESGPVSTPTQKYGGLVGGVSRRDGRNSSQFLPVALLKFHSIPASSFYKDSLPLLLLYNERNGPILTFVLWSKSKQIQQERKVYRT
jgi:hypothetical protein